MKRDNVTKVKNLFSAWCINQCGVLGEGRSNTTLL